MLPYVDRLIDLADEVLSMIAKKGQIELSDIQDRFSVTKRTANSVVDFLVKYGFAEFDSSEQYIVLSQPCKKFFAEIDD